MLGTRRRVIVSARTRLAGVGAGCLLVAAAAAFAGGSSASTGDTPSVAYQHDSAHSGGQAASLKLPLVRRWTLDLPIPQTNPVFSYPLIVDGRVYFTSFAYGGPSLLYAVDLGTGAVLWGPKQIGGNGHFSAPTYDEGRIFTVSSEGDVYRRQPRLPPCVRVSSRRHVELVAHRPLLRRRRAHTGDPQRPCVCALLDRRAGPRARPR